VTPYYLFPKARAARMLVFCSNSTVQVLYLPGRQFSPPFFGAKVFPNDGGVVFRRVGFPTEDLPGRVSDLALVSLS